MISTPDSVDPPISLQTGALMNGTPSIFNAEMLKLMLEHTRLLMDADAKKAFFAALAAFQGQVPIITKSQAVKYDSKGGGRKVEYFYENLATDIIGAIREPLKENGLACTFETDTVEGDGKVRVSCMVSHAGGYSTRTTLAAPIVNNMGDFIRNLGSTITYLQRYTLKAALGLAADKEEHGEGNAQAQVSLISKEQEEELKNMIVEAQVDLQRFFKAYGIAELNALPASAYQHAYNQLSYRLKGASPPHAERDITT